MDKIDENFDKYLYIRKTPTLQVRLLYSFGIVSWVLVMFGYTSIIFLDPFYTWFVFPVLLIITFYNLLSMGVNLLYKQFDLVKHVQFTLGFWKCNYEPSVDIYLPICGENTDILKNTWEHVAKINYKNKKVYVLDDSSENCTINKNLALSFGFEYIERPNKGENKKAGNLKYAYERTDGQFITIFDADFAPHPDFLAEAIPYMSEQNVGIVQTPQFFETSREQYKKSWLSYAAAYQEEYFYRIVQVAKNRVNAAICCGTNAIYRRSALDAIGGPRQVTASEDSRTGFAMLTKGFVTRYIPVILAKGICPDNIYAFFHQQHRWCRGRSELVLSEEFRKSSVPFLTKLCNISGFVSFFLRPLEILLTFQLFWVLFLYNDSISLGNAIIFYLYMFFTLFMMPSFHLIKFKKEVFFVSIIQTFSYAHSIVSVFMGRTVGWIPTNGKHTKVSTAFRQTTKIAALYVAVYTLMILAGLRSGDIKLLNYNYWSVQFWIIWNYLFSSLLLYSFVITIRQMKHGGNLNAQYIKSLLSEPLFNVVEQDAYYHNANIDMTAINAVAEPIAQQKAKPTLEVAKVIDYVGILGLGYLFFIVSAGYFGFVLGLTVNKWTLLTTFLLFTTWFAIHTLRSADTTKINKVYALAAFLGLSAVLYWSSTAFFAYTYDTSWDGQGYHSNGIISFVHGWNPIHEKNLPFKFPDAAMYSRGYPKALWYLQSTLYSATGMIYAGKVLNLAAMVIAFVFALGALQKLKIAKWPASIIALILVLQPPFFLQITTFMADLFSFQMLVIAVSAAVMFYKDTDNKAYLLSFLIAEAFLIGVKFSNIPTAGVLGLVFMYICYSQKFTIFKALGSKYVWLTGFGILLMTMIPYYTNYIYYKHPFYPSNLDNVSKSYKADNIPQNLSNANKFTLLFYGIFSESQLKQMGKADPQNVARLKVPFTFNQQEIDMAARIYNNRVGAAGPLFSGIVVVTVMIFLAMLFNTKINKVVLIMTGLCIVLAVVNPVTNLLRYNGQILLLPYFAVVLIFVMYQKNKVLVGTAYAVILLLAVNTVLFDQAVVAKVSRENSVIQQQLTQLKEKDTKVSVKAANFYSNVIRLGENGVNFQMSEKLDCKNAETLIGSHNTTKFCSVGGDVAVKKISTN
jgi:cellulose synthase (UDP-forming)